MTTYHSDREIVAGLRSRIKYDFGQVDLAKELKVSKAYISELLAGKRGVGERVLKALGYSPTPHYRKK